MQKGNYRKVTTDKISNSFLEIMSVINFLENTFNFNKVVRTVLEKQLRA